LVMTASCLLRMSWHCICHCCTSALASCSNVSCREHGAQHNRQHNTTCSCEHSSSSSPLVQLKTLAVLCQWLVCGTTLCALPRLAVLALHYVAVCAKWTPCKECVLD
jgi:hypothetical protein